MFARFLAGLFLLLIASPSAYPAVYIDGSQTPDGRFSLRVERVSGLPPKGPFRWQFVWHDTKEAKTARFILPSLSVGPVQAHLFLAPDGETFACFNPFAFHQPPESAEVVNSETSQPGFRKQAAFADRLIICKKTGEIVKTLSIHDLLKPEEWSGVTLQPDGVRWLSMYEDFKGKTLARASYAYYRVSRDHTVLELLPSPPLGQEPRTLRINLRTGEFLKEAVTGDQLPREPFQGAVELSADTLAKADRFVPSLDPTKSPGKFLVDPVANRRLEMLKDGFGYLHSPVWDSSRQVLCFTDLRTRKLYQLSGTGEVRPAQSQAGVHTFREGGFIGQVEGVLAAWKPGKLSETLLEKTPEGGHLFIDSLTATAQKVYFTSLKEPPAGRLYQLDMTNQQVKVVWDGSKEPGLANPGCLALAPTGSHLYVGVQSAQDRKRAGIYRFVIEPTGELDLALGKTSAWLPHASPQALAIDREGQVYVAGDGVIDIIAQDGTSRGQIKLPNATATGLTLGGKNDEYLFITTPSAIHVWRPK